MPFSTLTHWLRNRAATSPKSRLILDRLDDRTTPSATLVDVNNSFLGAGNKPSNLLDLSDDGRYVIFESMATDLIPGQQDIPNTNDLFWKDLQTGDTRMITALPPVTDTGYDYANTRLSPIGFALQAVIDGAPVKPSFNKAVIS